MTVFTIIMTLFAIGWTLLVAVANGMRAAPGNFLGGSTVATAWTIAAVFWFAWWVG